MKLYIGFVVGFLLAACPVSAQDYGFLDSSFPTDSGSGLAQDYGAGAPGAQFRESEQTAPQAEQYYTPGNITRRQGRTFPTGPQTMNAGDINGPFLPRAYHGSLANSSVNMNPIPSGQYDFGFDLGGVDPDKWYYDPVYPFADKF